ncbi:MAG: hypothetical protein PWQ10_517 [Patescibacteria group bacterium]|nr:hypothetical protein [Patescibacteria group bacterium]
MEAGIVYIIIVVVLFSVAFITKRRFGLLGLALSAGSLLNEIWSYKAVLVTSIIGVPSNILTTTMVSVVIILLPACLLLIHGCAYRSHIGKVIGAGLFAILALTFLIEPLSHVFVPQGLVATGYYWLMNNQNAIIGIGLVLSIVDLFFTNFTRSSEKRRIH